jgi:hypothetical protein
MRSCLCAWLHCIVARGSNTSSSCRTKYLQLHARGMSGYNLNDTGSSWCRQSSIVHVLTSCMVLHVCGVCGAHCAELTYQLPWLLAVHCKQGLASSSLLRCGWVH